MKLYSKIFCILSLIFLGVINTAFCQSAVYVYKNTDTASGDYMCMRGLPNQADAEFLTQQKLEELVNDDEMIMKYASTDEKGYGMIVRSTIELGEGKMPVFGAALACKSYKEAESKALSNLKKYNPEWTGSDYIIAYKFKDK